MKRLVLAVLLAGCSGGGGQPAATPTPAPTGATVSVGPTKAGALEERVPVTGHLQPLDVAEVSSQVTRKVERVAVRVGDRVSAGEPLIWLDSLDLQAQVGQAAASVRAAQAGVTKAAAGTPLTSTDVAVGLARAQQDVLSAQASRLRALDDLNDAKADLARKEKLFSQDAIPKTQLEQATLRFNMAQRTLAVSQTQERSAQESVRLAKAGQARNQVNQAEVAAAQAGVGQSQAALDAAEVQRTYAVLSTPIAGVVVERNVDPGQVVGPGNGKLLKIVDNRYLELIGPVPERYLPFLRPGLSTRLTSSVEPERKITARLQQVVPASDPSTHTVQVRVRVRDAKLVAGLYVEASVLVREHRGVLVPRSALLAEKGERYVLERQGDVVHRRPVTVTYESENQAVVSRGLTAGTSVVTGGGEGLADGAAIRVP